MADTAKYVPVGGANSMSDLKSLFSILKTRRTLALAYAFLLAFVAFTLFLALSPSPNASSPWFTNIFASSSSSHHSHFSSIFSYFFPTASSTSALPPTPTPSSTSLNNQTLTSLNSSNDTTVPTNHTSYPPLESPSLLQNKTQSSENSSQVSALNMPNQTENAAPAPKISVTPPPATIPNQNITSALKSTNYTASLARKRSNVSHTKEKEDLMESLMNCDLFHGEWVKDDSYPLYKPGSCDLIDEQFNCVQNGRADKDYQKYKWKPKDCTLPRLEGHRMLELLRGKRVVFVGDSLNRNMWESLICILRNSVKDKRKVYEANGRDYFRGEASYSFIFQDYKFSLELFVSPFLVQEWEIPDKNGRKKETLRLDLVGRSSDQYKDADIIIFNTGHWWTHDKTSRGKDYYQEGSHVYDELNVLEAFRRALTTWSRWVDANINPSKTMVFFRGYSASHFSGGQWNSGGQCDNETEPIKNEKYLNEYPPKMRVLENVLKYMKTHVSYLNITRMTDFRKDGHPSIYRKQKLSREERRSPLKYQDCSHWCLPGVPDAWNEILYAELLMKQYRDQHRHHKRP